MLHAWQSWVTTSSASTSTNTRWRSFQQATPRFTNPCSDELLSELEESGRLRFTTDMAAARGAEVHFICVGTPQKRGENGADLRYVDAAVAARSLHTSPPATSSPGNPRCLWEPPRGWPRCWRTQSPAPSLVWNPEFLREGHAVTDTLNPDRFVYGTPDGSEDHPAVAVLDRVYETPLAGGTPRLVTDYATAELVKTAANSFLATKISFINAMAEVCEATGADVTRLADAIGLDERIGRKFLNAGIGFGGGCLPKDIRAFMARAGELGADQASDLPAGSGCD